MVYFENEITIFAFDDENYIQIILHPNYSIKSKIKNQLLTGHSSMINCLCIVDKEHLLSGSNDTTIKLWNIFTSECVRTLLDTTILLILSLVDQMIEQ